MCCHVCVALVCVAFLYNLTLYKKKNCVLIRSCCCLLSKSTEWVAFILGAVQLPTWFLFLPNSFSGNRNTTMHCLLRNPYGRPEGTYTLLGVEEKKINILKMRIKTEQIMGQLRRIQLHFFPTPCFDMFRQDFCLPY